MAILSEWAGPPVEWAGPPVSLTLLYLRVSEVCLMLPGQYVPVRATRGALVAHCILIRLLAAEPRSTAGPLFLSQYPCRTILLTLYSMVWY